MNLDRFTPRHTLIGFGLLLLFLTSCNLMNVLNKAEIRTCIRQCMEDQPIADCNQGCRLDK